MKLRNVPLNAIQIDILTKTQAELESARNALFELTTDDLLTTLRTRPDLRMRLAADVRSSLAKLFDRIRQRASSFRRRKP
jgi:hypothetical protein